MPLAIRALIAPRKRGHTYGFSRIEEWRHLRDFNRRCKQMRNNPPDAPLAIEIEGEDVKAIEAMVWACDDSWNRNRPDAPMYHDDLVKQLYERVGAATTTDAAQMTVPLYEYEISSLELMLPLLSRYGGAADNRAARHLLNKLHALQGRARVMRTLGGIPVTRPAIER
ncbi:hypothetical protein [Actinacidiphila acididurans]|uniref:Uncharacterized protein n=1 Tax=Actinacidiphila acididurans TaxID=2784346 RepID=A0ABS2U2Y2_9ACTN|nr:hypothetical protein [Actinacidiphila acididurans]MBM9509953.1 hypothetical protein [Actinacidiphila acididurans]